jgi:hypothetical protein
VQKRTKKKNNQKSASEAQKSKKLSSDALKNVLNALYTLTRSDTLHPEGQKSKQANKKKKNPGIKTV